MRPASGITIDNNGKRYIWANNVGVQELTPDGWNTILSAQAVQTNTVFDIQDLAVLDDNRIALVAQNEGTVVSRQTAQALNRFCYLPGSLQQQDRTAWQLSRALAFDASENRLYVQPQTFTGFGTEATTSQLGLFDPAISEPLEWQSFSDKNFAAGGMAVVSRQGTYLGAGSKLYRYNAAEKRFDKWWELSGLSISNIEGLAADRTTNTLVVLDGARQELVDLRLDEIQ
ncbi:MAG: hypothetical protein Q8K32_26220 [Archangium sp.]|nr:hypothetical protein [Archangium sp.]